MKTKTQTAINNTRTLDELCSALNLWVPENSYQSLNDVCDLADLPTFGGVTPEDTTGAWSWDADSVLLFDHGRYYIEARNPDAWYNGRAAFGEVQADMARQAL